MQIEALTRINAHTHTNIYFKKQICECSLEIKGALVRDWFLNYKFYGKYLEVWTSFWWKKIYELYKEPFL